MYVCADAESLSPEQLAALRSGSNYTFQTEVNRVMKLIINSLYRNKEVHLYWTQLHTTTHTYFY